MKIRLVKLGNGKYAVQFKKDFFDSWSNHDYSSTLEEAIKQYEKEVEFYTEVKKTKEVVTVIKQITI